MRTFSEMNSDKAQISPVSFKSASATCITLRHPKRQRKEVFCFCFLTIHRVSVFSNKEIALTWKHVHKGITCDFQEDTF